MGVSGHLLELGLSEVFHNFIMLTFLKEMLTYPKDFGLFPSDF